MLQFLTNYFLLFHDEDSAGRKRESLLTNGGSRPVLLRRQLTGDLLVCPPSTMSVTPVKTVDRRLSVELRTQLERTRRSRFSDELKVSLALLAVIAVFVVSWAPISIVNAIETFQLAVIPRPVERTHSNQSSGLGLHLNSSLPGLIIIYLLTQSALRGL